MKCAECQAYLQDDAKFCHHCGAKVTPLRPTDGLGNRSALADREEVFLWSGTFSALGLIHSWLLAILITIALPVGGAIVPAGEFEWMVIACVIGLVWVGLGLLLVYQKLDVHYELTDQRFIHRSGILSRRTDRIELIDIDDVSHRQGLIERLFDVGTIVVSSSDRSHPRIELRGVSDVDGVAMLIDDARRRERLRRGIHIEQI